MNKKMVALAMAVVFAFCTVGVGFAARLKCTVDTVEGEKVMMTCKDADKLSPGDKLKVSATRKNAIEGC